jgi:hypothetical protein
MSLPALRAEHTPARLTLLRGSQPLITQHAAPDSRPYIHPIIAPDGDGTLTENRPTHHPWQHGLYVGLNDVNGVGFWKEGGKGGGPTDGTFHPEPLAPPKTEGERASWKVVSEWRRPDGTPLLSETQVWTLTDRGETLLLDMAWSLRGLTVVTFGRYEYGGLFLRMPFRAEAGGNALNSEGRRDKDTEQQRARWVAVSLPIPDRKATEKTAYIAILDHPANPEHPAPWRVDGQLGVAPSRCIAGAWKLGAGETTTSRYRLVIETGAPDLAKLNSAWDTFAKEVKL